MSKLYINPDTINPETGLPDLPGDWFWKVTVFQMDSKHNRYKIAVYMPRKVFGVRVRAAENDNYWTLFSTSDVAGAARKAVIYGNDREQSNESVLDRTILGSYPPKSVA